MDTDFAPVIGSAFYKLLMSDDTELGMRYDSTLGWLADESPSNGGAIIQISKASPPPDPGAVWTNGDLAYVRGASYENGTLVELYLYIFRPLGSVMYVGWIKDITKATRF